MIHKFRDMPANLNLRKNIYVFIDEAHPTTSGDLGNFLMAALPNASFISFAFFMISKFTDEGIPNPEKVADKVREAFKRHPNWKPARLTCGKPASR
jgi:SWI2/SNF2 ATPase